MGEKNPEIESIIENIKEIKTSWEDEGKATREKPKPFLYQHAASFLPTGKFMGDFPISDKFLPNMSSIAKDKIVIHHSHATGKIIGYVHGFCNQRIRENYYTIPDLLIISSGSISSCFWKELDRASGNFWNRNWR